jgi:hypothetical protein
MGSVIDDDLKLASLHQYFLLALIRIGVSHNHYDARIIVLKVRATDIYVATDDFFGLRKILPPNIKRTTVLNADL